MAKRSRGHTKCSFQPLSSDALQLSNKFQALASRDGPRSPSRPQLGDHPTPSPGCHAWAGWQLRCHRRRHSEPAASWSQRCWELARLSWLDCWPSGLLCCSCHRSGLFGPSAHSPCKRSVLHRLSCCHYPSGLYYYYYYSPWPPVFCPHLGPCLTCCHQGPALQVVGLATSWAAPTLGACCWHLYGLARRGISGQTFCYPGACVKDNTPTALQLIQQHSSASAVVVQAGTNNIKNRQSEILKGDFVSLVDSLLDTRKQVIISFNSYLIFFKKHF